jgi:L-lactate dehydrogenase (cytochrome)
MAAAGEAGVRHCIDILAQELRMTMALCGARNLAELDRDLLRRLPVASPHGQAV